MEHPLIILASGKTYEGFLVIDSLFNNRSAGGVRIADDLVLEEVRELAREMTIKLALFRLPRGGGKAGVRLAEGLDAEGRSAALRSFGRHCGPIIRTGLYNPAMDMNCGPEELRTIYAGAGLEIPPPTDTSFYTAISAANALLGYAEVVQSARPLTMAIEGFGNVARHMMTLLPEGLFRVTGISTVIGAVRNAEGFDPQELCREKDLHGDDLVAHLPGERIAHDDLLATDVDVLVPAARVWSITRELAERIQVRAVVPVANAPYRAGAAEILHDRGMLVLPGYLCNAGGVFGSSMADSGVPRKEIEELFRLRYRPLIKALVRMCLQSGRAAIPVVERLAVREARKRAQAQSQPSILRKLGERARRQLPVSLRRRAMWNHCIRSLDALEADFREVGIH
ncbi:MAG: Glu/Leu/Phe/Val dehydrogenase [Candidatus Eisenbacteria sp.]|nr:Glu/Leu/Phe/Val dehydrogenase [Candidatus Eisenbacteria bacterium]